MGDKGKPHFPIFVDLSDKKVVVAGAGTIAKRRIRVLADFTDHLVVIAPEVNQELKELEAEGKITIIRKTFEREDIACDRGDEFKPDKSRDLRGVQVLRDPGQRLQ